MRACRVHRLGAWPRPVDSRGEITKLVAQKTRPLWCPVKQRRADHRADGPGGSSSARQVRQRAVSTPTRALLLRVVLVICGAHLARGAEPTPSLQAPTPTVGAIPVVEIAERATHTDSLVRSIRARLAPDDTINAIARNLPASAKQIAQLSNDTASQVAVGLTPQALDDLRRQWLLIRDQLAKWNQMLAARTTAVQRDSDGLAASEESWAQTEAVGRASDFPEALREPIRVAQASIREAQSALRTQRDSLLALLGHVSSLQTEVAEALAQIDFTEQQMRRSLLSADATPLWKFRSASAHAQPLTEAAWAGVVRSRNLTRAFVQQQSVPLILQAIVLVALIAGTLRLSRRARSADGADDVPDAIQAVVSRPISAALVLTLLLGAALHPYAPIIVATTFGVFGIVPIMRLFRGPGAPQIRLTLLLLGLLLVASTLRRLLPPFVPTGRLLLVAESSGSIVATLVIMRSARLAQLEMADPWRRLIKGAMWTMVVLLAIAVVGNVIGNVTLAILLTDGVLGTATSGVAFVAATRVLEAMVIQLLGSEPTQRLRSVARHQRALHRRANRVIRAAMTILWFSIVLKLFGLLRTCLDAVGSALAARLTIGAVSLSLSDILTVLLTLWVAFFIARIIRIVLEEDALPRLSLPRGVPAAISVGVNYVILLIGFVFALSAAGVDAGRVTLIAGALGVGIGFGLQNIVNNFLSGIILLFERPIQIGDIISFGAINGQVRRIGFRSSTIATFDGAEVLVPNGTLVSEHVINWTLSNDQRRIEIKVGVAYGNDPTAVIAVLEGAAKTIHDILEQPPVRALFTGFGESSLDFTLWAWTDRQDSFAAIRSELAVAVYDALQAARMEIPFPQREMRVKRVEPAAPPVAANADDEELH